MKIELSGNVALHVSDLKKEVSDETCIMVGLLIGFLGDKSSMRIKLRILSRFELRAFG